MRYRPTGSHPEDSRLGRYVPDDDRHIREYPVSAVQSGTIEVVERKLVLPRWHGTHDQVREGSCVGHGAAFERAVTNTAQNRLAAILTYTRRYDPIHLWNGAKACDQWAETNPGDNEGTSVRAAYDVLRVEGARIIRSNGIRVDDSLGKPVVTDQRKAPSLEEGILTNRWARTVDEMRTAIASGNAVVIGVNWYSGLDHPVKIGRDWWIKGDLGRLRGGHCVCVVAASDKRQAFLIKNSWGKDYPLVWISYADMQRLLNEDGEATLQTDK